MIHIVGSIGAVIMTAMMATILPMIAAMYCSMDRPFSQFQFKLSKKLEAAISLLKPSSVFSNNGKLFTKASVASSWNWVVPLGQCT